MAGAELELGCCCYFPACAELGLDCCCYYPTGRGLRLPSRRQITGVRARSWSWTAAANTTLNDVNASRAPYALPSVRARLLLLLLDRTTSRFAPSFAPPGGVRSAGAGLLLLVPFLLWLPFAADGGAATCTTLHRFRIVKLKVFMGSEFSHFNSKFTLRLGE